MRKPPEKEFALTLFLALIFGLFIAFLYNDHKQSEIHYAEMRAERVRINNAECKILREGDTSLIGIKCKDLGNNIYEIETVTGMFVKVHSSRVVPNGSNGLIKPYKE